MESIIHMEVMMIWRKCLKYIGRHRLASIVLCVILLYQVARIAHLGFIDRPFELLMNAITEVIIARYTGDSE